MRSGMPASLRGDGRAGGAVENPDRAETAAAQQRDQPDQIEATPQFRAGMLEIDRLGDARLGRQQFLARRSTAARERSPGRPGAPRRWRG